MKYLSALLGLATLTTAQYFSPGWSPGQPSKKVPAASFSLHGYTSAPTPTPTGEKGFKGLLSIYNNFHAEDLLTHGPIATALAGFGIDLKEKVDSAKISSGGGERFKDSKIQFITDGDYEEVFGMNDVEEVGKPPVGGVVYEEEEEKEKESIWFVLVTMGPQDTISHVIDQHFEAAYNYALERNDLPHVKWGRIDYLNVTEVTTRWLIFRAPVLVIVQDKGTSLRYFKPLQLPLKSEPLHTWLKNEEYKKVKPWTGAWSPAGRRGPWLHKIAIYSAKSYTLLLQIPRWLLLILTGTIASALVNLMHRVRSKPKPTPQRTKTAEERGRVGNRETPKVVITEASEERIKKGEGASPTKKRKGKKASQG